MTNKKNEFMDLLQDEFFGMVGEDDYGFDDEVAPISSSSSTSSSSVASSPILPPIVPKTCKEVIGGSSQTFKVGGAYSGAVLQFGNGEFPELFSPQVPKKISLKLKGFHKSEHGTPTLVMKIWAENPSAVRTSNNEGWQRSTLEKRPKRNEGSWTSATSSPLPFEKTSSKNEEYTWSSFLQFTHLSHYEKEMRPSTGKMMVLFFVKGSKARSPGAGELLLMSPKITVTRREKKNKKENSNARGSLSFRHMKKVKLDNETEVWMPPPQSPLVIDWFNAVYPEEYQLCNMMTTKSLRDFTETERKSLPQLAKFFDQAALVLAEVETKNEDASDLAKAVHAHMAKTKFKTCATCTVRASELREMYNGFEGEWWKDNRINERFEGADGRKNTIMSKITTDTVVIEKQFKDFEAKFSHFKKDDPDLLTEASELDVPGLLISFQRFSLDILTCARMDIDTLMKMKSKG
eukprot:CAMPEP_0118660108 /NCGR_PEP_ID=MMETSP0785-20121206/15484_1 /TAXON_ID=91992 /ORGANISM="Bolidomonas pacifica, Strain CCMP 1866" /LENGTH=461 /DNA_ID=CAMNT_0006553287 /DNA_START=154 /DNA_END=1536 /DNA_ORIENTATION=+